MITPVEPAPHIPVLYQPVLDGLAPRPGGYYVDGTLGAGGHAEGVLLASAPDGRLLGLDLDPQALGLATDRLAPFGERVLIRQASYGTLADQLKKLNWPLLQGICLDLGVSSMQLDTANRGFSFQSDGLLDMRFDPNNPVTAASLVNTLSERDLADLLWTYGEEPASRRIARAIVAARPLSTTRELAEVIVRISGSHRRGIHPATLTFQALRIAVNRELNTLESVLPQAVNALAPGGRLAIISFHSLEDRLVKQFFIKESRDCLCPPQQPICTCGHRASLKILTRHPVMADEAEMAVNPRARSAKLRVAEKMLLA